MEKIEETVLAVIMKIEGKDGVKWDDIDKECEKSGLNKAAVADVVSYLLADGFIYEPVLGMIKTTKKYPQKTEIDKLRRWKG